MIILFKSHIKDRFIFLSLLLSIIFFILSTWFIFDWINWKAERIFLHYNIIFGVDRIGEPKDLWFFLIGALIILLINYFLSLFLYTKDKIISRVILAFTSIWQIFLFVAIYFIVSLNS